MKSGTKTPSLSNHSPVYAYLNIKRERSKCYTRSIWNLKQVNWKDLNTHLKQVDWSPAFSKPNASEIVTEWTDIYITEIKKFIPFKQVRIRPNDAKWMTPELRRLMRKRNRIYRTAKKRNTEEQWNKFKKLRNDVIRKVREAKEEFVKKDENYINDSKGNDPKTWWKLVKQYYTQNAAIKSTNSPLIFQDQLITDDKAKANMLNDFFASQTNLENQDQELPMHHPLTKENISIVNVTATTVKDILSILKTSK